MVTRIKLTLETENRLINTPKLYDELINKIKDLFKERLPQPFKIFYYDSDNDLITITTSNDYDYALTQFQGQIRLYISKTAETIKQSVIINKPIVEPKKPGEILAKVDLAESKMYESKPIIEEEVKKKTEEKKQEAITLKTEPEKELTVKKPPPVVDVYACFYCNGEKLNKRGKICKGCEGTGRVSEAFLEKIRKVLKNELSSAFQTEFINASKIFESQKLPQEKRIEEQAKKEEPVSKSVIYKIAPEKKEKKDYRTYCVSESIKDGHKVNPGEVFEKVWKYKNVGSEPWPSDTLFLPLNEEKLDIKVSPVGEVQPGAEIEIKATITAPTMPKKYVTKFKFTYGSNSHFGEIPWVDFDVVNKQ